MKFLRSHGVFALALMISLGLVWGAYSNFFGNSFHFDDFHTIEENLYIRSLENIPEFFKNSETFSTLPDHQSYRPLTTLLMALDYARAQNLDVFVFHTTQLLLLGFVGLLLFFFFHFLMNKVEPQNSNRYWALFGATLFCLHITNTETMNIISHRSELLSTAGVLGSFLIYFYWKQGRKFKIYLIPMVLGALAKPPAVIFAPLLFVYLIFFEADLSVGQLFKRKNLPRFGSALKVSLPAILLGIAVFIFIGQMDGPHLNYSEISRWDYLKTQPFVWLHYMRLFFFPVGLTADTDWQALERWYDTRFWMGAFGLTLLGFLITVLSRNRIWRLSSFGLVWFALALLPSSSFFPLSEIYNEHRIFFPYMGMVLAVVWALAQGLRHIQKRPSYKMPATVLGIFLALIVASSMAYGTFERNKVWQTGETLWLDVSQKSPRNGRALMNYGLTQMRQGRLKIAKDYFEKAKIYNPNYSTLEINLGVVYSQLGEEPRAEGHFRRALSLSPNYPAAHYYYAKWLMKLKRPHIAMRHLEKALELSPSHPDANYLLLQLYAAGGQMEQFKQLAKRIHQIEKNNELIQRYEKEFAPFAQGWNIFQTQYNSGLNLLKKREFLKAAQFFQQSLNSEPENADAHNNLGWSQSQLGFTQEAIRSFERALALRPDYERARNNLNLIRGKNKMPEESP